MKTMNVKLDKWGIMPTKAHASDAGYDLYSPMYELIPSGEWRNIDTGVHFEIPDGYVGFIKSRSGLNTKGGLTCEGVIDAGYTGSIGVCLRNHSDIDATVENGVRIAQIVFLPIASPELVLVEEFKETERGDNGFGSSGF